MQIQDMRALRSLRSSSLLFNLTKYNLNSPFTLSLHKPHQNPQICLQFRPIHSITRKSSPQSPALENNPPNSSNSDPDPPQNPRTWSVFNTRTNDLVKPKATSESSEIEAEEAEIESNSPNWVPRVRNDSVSKGKFGGNGDVTGINRKKGKVRKYWVCSNCGRGTGQWWGSCRECNGVGTLKQFTVGNVDGKVNGFEVSENATQSWLPKEAVWDGPVRLTDVNRGINQMEWRIPLIGLFGAEVARVLGGGVVPGSLILVGGDPGVGKSTLMLQMAANIAESCVVGQSAPVLYVSGEEAGDYELKNMVNAYYTYRCAGFCISVEQIGNRADRMRIGTDELYLYSSTDIEDILAKIQLLSPRAVVIDSIQTVYLKGVTGSPGGLIQVKECTSALLRFSKKTNIPVLLVGHVNKAGELAGPRVLEHIVDVVLYMEGEKHSSHRLLRSVKNRFGSTDELGIFEMSESGLQGVANPSGMFLREQQPDSEHLAGLAVAAVIDGSRTFIIEVQALCVSGTSVARHVNGVPPSRADMIISVLMKQAGLKLDNNAVYLNVVSGASLSETAGDLAVAAAICSSFLEFPIPSNFAFIGEIDLAGELRMVPRIEKRASTLAKLGYKMCVVPKSAESCLAALDHEGMQIVGCKNMKEVIHKVFTKH